MVFSAPPADLIHQQRVLQFFFLKYLLPYLQSWCIHWDTYWYFACLVTEKLEEHKN